MMGSNSWLKITQTENFELEGYLGSVEKPSSVDCNSLKFKNVSVKVKDKLILKNAVGEVYEGEFLALMGPSGSGKTTLLNVLSQRYEYMGISKESISGTIALGDLLITRHDKKRIGYVMQTDFFFQTLTLKETILFHARMKLSSKVTDEEKVKTAMSLVASVNLQDCLNTKVGGKFVRGLSGGQLRRLSIIVELLTDPEILFMDEPTSGLDSKMALSVIANLKALAKTKHRIIVCSIHQPNSQIFSNFDKVLFLSHGSMIYFGFVNDISSYFANCGYYCPEDWNIADYTMDILRSDKTANELLVEKFKDATLENDIKIKSTLDEDDTSTIDLPSYPIPYGSQLKILFERSFNISMTEHFSPVVLVKNLLSAIIMGTVWYKSPITDQGFNTMLGLIFFGVLFCFANPIFETIFVFMQDSVIVKKEIAGHMYYPSAYYLSKFFTEIPMLSIHPFIEWTVVYWMSNLGVSAWYSVSLLMMCMTALLANGTGLLIGSFLLEYDESVAVTSIYFTVALLMGGFYIRVIPSWIAWLKYLSPIFYSFIVQTWIILLTNNGLECQKVVLLSAGTPITPSLFEACIRNETRVSPKEVMNYMGAGIGAEYFAILTIGLFFLTHVAAYLNLKRNLTKTHQSEGLYDKIIRSKIYNKLFNNKTSISTL